MNNLATAQTQPSSFNSHQIYTTSYNTTDNLPSATELKIAFERVKDKISKQEISLLQDDKTIETIKYEVMRLNKYNEEKLMSKISNSLLNLPSKQSSPNLQVYQQIALEQVLELIKESPIKKSQLPVSPLNQYFVSKTNTIDALNLMNLQKLQSLPLNDPQINNSLYSDLLFTTENCDNQRFPGVIKQKKQSVDFDIIEPYSANSSISLGFRRAFIDAEMTQASFPTWSKDEQSCQSQQGDQKLVATKQNVPNFDSMQTSKPSKQQEMIYQIKQEIALQSNLQLNTLEQKKNHRKSCDYSQKILQFDKIKKQQLKNRSSILNLNQKDENSKKYVMIEESEDESFSSQDSFYVTKGKIRERSQYEQVGTHFDKQTIAASSESDVEVDETQNFVNEDNSYYESSQCHVSCLQSHIHNSNQRNQQGVSVLNLSQQVAEVSLLKSKLSQDDKVCTDQTDNTDQNEIEIIEEVRNIEQPSFYKPQAKSLFVKDVQERKSTRKSTRNISDLQNEQSDWRDFKVPKKSSPNGIQKKFGGTKQLNAKMEILKQQKEKYSKQFQFFYSRTCFRDMKDFFKHMFDKTQGRSLPKNLQLTKKEEIDACISEFLTKTLRCGLLTSEQIGPVGKQQLINSMLMYVFAHRHTKVDLFLIETQDQIKNQLLHGPRCPHHPDQDKLYASFDLIRNVMYKYSKRAQDEFFKNIIESYYFVLFATSPEAHDFILNKDDMVNNQDKRSKIFNEIQQLSNEAQNELNKRSNEGGSKGCCQVAKALFADLQSKL